ncbi:MAG: helix-turn-helix domain-containing protein, partial [Candidatus Hodarchaeota archaeon]
MSGTDFEEETYSTIFSSLKHPIRRRILRMLDGNPSTFSDILEELRIDSGHMNYHLDQLGILLTKADTNYSLSAFGRTAVGLMKGVEEPLPKIGHRNIDGLQKRILAGFLMLILVSSTLGLTSLCYYGENNQLRLQLVQYFNSLGELQEDLDELSTANEATRQQNQELYDALQSRREEVKLFQDEFGVLKRLIGGLRNWISNNQRVLELNAANLITSEPGRLSVWGYDELHQAYVDIWTTDNVYYDSVAIGDIGNDGLREIVGTASIDMMGTIIHNATCRWAATPYLSFFPPFDIFFEVYKEGQSGISATSEAVKDTAHDRNEITIADVDPVYPGNEVVMKTRHWLVVYDSEYKIVGKTDWFVEEVQVIFEGIAVANIDDDSQNEIIVSGNLEGLENSGHLFIFDLVVDPKLESPTILRLDRPVGGIRTG